MTSQDLQQIDALIQKRLKNVVTKDDIKGFATKGDLGKFVTKDDIKSFATKDDLKKEICGLKSELEHQITESFQDMKEFVETVCVTKNEYNGLEKRITALETELHAA